MLGTFPTKMRRKNPARESAKKSGGSKIKIREKSVLPKAGPKICAEVHASRFVHESEIVALVSVNFA